MPIHLSAWGDRLWSWMMRFITWIPGKETLAPADISPEVEAYQASMTTDFNRIHNRVYLHFFRRIQVETFTLGPIQRLPKDAAIVYVTPTIGQLEYNYFNYLYNQERLPLPQLANGLSLFFWRPWGDMKRLARRYLEAVRNTGHLPSPVRNTLWQRLIEAGTPTLICLKTSRLHDDLYWEDPQEDPLAAVITAARQPGARPVTCVPQDFIWSKHPERPQSAFTLFLIGDRDKRGPIRRFFYFLLYYKRHAIVKFGMPLVVQDWLKTQPPDAPLPALIQQLRIELLTQLRIERTAITGPGLKPRAWLIEQALYSDPVQRCIYELAQDRGKPVAQFQHLASRYADEIAADPHHSIIEIAARVMHWALVTLYDGITIDEEGLERVKRVIGQGPVVLVPNHRSHMDYLLLATILYSRNVAVPFIAGGINMNFWPVGPIFRHCGAYFLRRSFGGNPLYKAVFQAYITELVRQGYCQEFFIEGTRSRTGKMAHPRLGMASMLVESWREGAARDITFVPVSLTYDQVMEVKSYTREFKGAGKAAERTRDILKLGRFFKRRWGHVYLRFGEPISLGLTTAELWSYPDPRLITADTKPQLVRHLVQTILYAINKHAVITPAAVTAMVLLASSGPHSLEDVTQKTRLLLDYIVWKGAACAPGLTNMTEVLVQGTLARLMSQKFITAAYEVIPGHCNTLDYAKNTGIHFFVSIACLSRLIVHHANASPLAFEDIHRGYDLLKELFRFEFNFSTRRTIAEHLHTLLGYLKTTGMITEPEPDHYNIGTVQRKNLVFFSQLLDNYLLAYRTLFQFMRTTPPADGPERQWFKAFLQWGRLTAGKSAEESLSKFIFQNGIMLLQELGGCSQTASGSLHWNGTNDRFDALQHLISSIST